MTPKYRGLLFFLFLVILFGYLIIVDTFTLFYKLRIDLLPKLRIDLLPKLRIDLLPKLRIDLLPTNAIKKE